MIALIGVTAHGVVQALESARLVPEEQAGTDPLTGVGSRSSTFERLDALMSEAGGDPLGVLMIDLDFFKSVNDQYGHLAGDEVLRGVALRLRHHVRERDHVGRIGGEEFLVILRDLRSPAELRAIAEKLRIAVERTPLMAGPGLRIDQTISLGAVLVKPPALSLRDVIATADHALYEAKLNGRNQTRLAPPSSRAHPGARPLGADDDGTHQRITERLARRPSALQLSRAVVDRLAPALPERTLADARMIVNELVASRLRAGEVDSPFLDLVVERRAGQLLIQVERRRPGALAGGRSPAPAGLGRMGLSIVGELSSSWGTHTDESTRIWARLPFAPTRQPNPVETDQDVRTRA